jgi:type I restriction enzyme S subunit
LYLSLGVHGLNGLGKAFEAIAAGNEHILSSGILPDFLNFALMYYPFAPLTSGTTGRRKLTQPTLMGIEIPVPPLCEQKRIVKRVEEFWKLCDQLEESLRQQQQQAEALVASAISHLAA